MKITKARLRGLKSRYYLFEYSFIATAKHLIRILMGSSVHSRLNRYPGAVFKSSPYCDSRRVAIFAAFHENDRLPSSNRLYLEALQRSRFRIIYVHNGPLESDVMNQIGEYCERVFCRENVGQDMGAWKDGYLFYREIGFLNQINWLLMCNDSNFFLGGDKGDAFVEILSNELDNGDSEVIALNKNYELWQHYQAFFLCYRNSIFQSKKFYDFWVKYMPLDNRYHAIENGEIKLTCEILNAVRAKVLYNSIDLISCLDKLAENSNLFYSFLPQNALYLAPGETINTSIGVLGLHRILALLDHYNTSHVYALLFVYFLNSPFIKKDVLRQGIFSLAQIYLCLKEIDVEESFPELHKEIIRALQSGGTNISYIRYPRQAVRKGINTHASFYSGYGEALDGLGLRSSG